MRFAASNIHSGINTTIRMDRKWLEEAKINDRLFLCDMDENKLALGKILAIRPTKLSEVTQEEIDNLACAVPSYTLEALSETLVNIYRNFDPDNIAVVTFMADLTN